MVKNFLEDVWKLSRRVYPKCYNFSTAKTKFYFKEHVQIPVPALSVRPGNITCLESHSSRSAWFYVPWRSGDQWYPGIEYKGIGFEGQKIRLLNRFAWGGVELPTALAEHNLSKIAFNAGVFCQRPVGCYDYGTFEGKKLAVIARTFASPLRLSDFLFETDILNAYLAIRKQTEKEYCNYLASTLGKSIRKMFDIGLYHGAMELNNITTEGEIADFEPTYGGTWEGVMPNTEPRFRVLALYRLFSDIDHILPNRKKYFITSFARAFLQSDRPIPAKQSEKKIVEAYIGKKLTKKNLFIEFPPRENFDTAIQILKHELAQSKTETQRQRIAYLINQLS
ncbi:MAG: hypothetical protein ABH829_00290 [archaeon]